MSFLKKLGASFLSIVVSSCSTLLPSPAETYLLRGKDLELASEPYSYPAARDDIEILLRFFRTGYAGYPFIDKRLVEVAETRLKSLPSIGTENWPQLCEQIAEAVHELPDGHLGSKFREQSCFDEKRSLSRRSHIGRNIAHEVSERAYAIQSFVREKSVVTVLGIEKFPPFEDAHWKGFESEVARIKENSTALIIDLRGNGGGDDSRGIQLASFLKGSWVRKQDFAVEHQHPGAEASVLMLNRLLYKEKRNPSEPWSRYRAVYENRLKGSFHDEPQGDDDGSLKKNQNFGAPFPGAIIVLADAQCGSSGESTLQAIRSLKNVKFVGQNTAGITHFGNQGLLLLPHSKIQVSLSTKFIEFKDGTFIEKVGYVPDVYVTDGHDALIDAKRILGF